MNREVGARNSADTEIVSLKQLSEMTFDELDSLFRKGSVPTSLSALGNEAPGRALAVRHLDRGVVARMIRLVAGSSHFPWIGKSLTWDNDGRTGGGFNRVRFGRALFPYKLQFGESIIDGRKSIIFDYDHSGNSKLGRRLYNELREVSPGVFLGPVTWRKGDGRRWQPMWFAVATGLRT